MVERVARRHAELVPVRRREPPWMQETPARGEVVILISGAESEELSEERLGDEARKLKTAGMTPREIVDRLISEHGTPRNLAYRLAHES